MRPPHDLNHLLARVAAGEHFGYICFWGHQPAKNGHIGKSCLSQWFDAAFDLDGVRYATAEHFMMAQKARHFGDEATHARVLAAATPAEAKQLGRQVAGFDDVQWQAVRFDVAVRGNVGKFGQNAALRAFLLGTGDQVLVEASPVDAVWGIGLAATDATATRPEAWRGLNLLGFALMVARERLLDGQGEGEGATR